jgi:hypothetical protein
MKWFWRSLALIGVCLLILAVVVGALLLGRLDEEVRKHIEVACSAATGTRCTVDGVQLDILAGTLGVTGLKIGNPEGFQDEHIMTVSSIYVDVNLPSLRKDPVQVGVVEVNGLRINYEQTAGASNLKTVLDYARNATQSAQRRPDKRVQVERVSIDPVQVRLNLRGKPPFVNPMQLNLKLPDIEIYNPLNAQGEFPTPEQLLTLISTQITQAILNNPRLPNIVTTVLGDTVNNMFHLFTPAGQQRRILFPGRKSSGPQED